MSYLPLAKFDKLSIVPSEKDNYFRHQLLHGYVHDMGAAMLGGVGGHAGLFANSNDVAKMMQCIPSKRILWRKTYFDKSTINLFNNCNWSSQ